ncbi:hypothetical protein FD09_GL000809 [Schleiferilactobacillus perolens DSM 12744]|uniref:Uncharacterized protein n=1 Tax=Schleiferilactobacillus perolens DSM 12744 TaxID=1423792 RepID=A0A0R1N130_9LACO|nr:hypothetical protein FD09_GL000809 [Schleiferilactobacillus perolens DSM 12744]
MLNKAYASVTTTADYAAVSASVKTANLLVRENGLIIDEDNKLAYPAIEPRSLPDDQVYLGWDGIHEIFRSNAAVQNRVNYLNAVGTSLTASGVAAGLVGGPAGWLIGSIVGVIQFGVYNPSSQATALKEYNMKHKNDRIWMITPWKVWDYYFGVQHD